MSDKELGPVSWSIQPAGDFARLASQWQTLNQQCGPSLLLDPRFIVPLMDNLPAPEAMLVFGHHQQQIIAAGIFFQQGWGRWQTLQFSQAPLGLWLCLPDYFNDRLMATLARALPGWVGQISLTQQDPVFLPHPGESRAFRSLEYITTARLTLPPDFQSYFDSLSRNARHNANKANNRLKKTGISVRFEVEKAVEQLPQAVADYGDMESAGWKQEGGTAVAADNAQGAFYRQMLTAYASEQAEVWNYYYDQQKVASDLCIRDGEQLIILKTTYLESWKKYSPAFALHLAGISHCIDQGLKTIEFYGPAMAWHLKLTQDLRTLYHLNWYSSPVLPGLVKMKQRLLST